MQAISVDKAGDSSVLKYTDVSEPICGDDEVLIKLKAIGINFIDIYIRQGLYPVAAYPYIPGKEGSGDVIAVGKNVKDIKVGDRVGFCNGGRGSYSEIAAVLAEQVVPLPDNISYEIAAASLLQGLTAVYLTHATYHLQKNDVALVHAGAGGVGLLLIQIAKILGATVITTVSTPDKAEMVKNAGADKIILYSKENFREEVMRFTNNVGVNVVYDAVGKTTFMDSLASLTTRGMLVSYGQASGPVEPLPLSALAPQSLYLTRPTLFHYTKTKSELLALTKILFDLIQTNKITVTIGQQYLLKDAALAHQNLESRKTVGKSLLHF